MGILLGMTLLLLVVISIQIMLVEKRVLQRIGALEVELSKMEELPKRTRIEIGGQKKEEQMQKSDVTADMARETEAKVREKESPEDLLNEVLSEVFS